LDLGIGSARRRSGHGGRQKNSSGGQASAEVQVHRIDTARENTLDPSILIEYSTLRFWHQRLEQSYEQSRASGGHQNRSLNTEILMRA